MTDRVLLIVQMPKARDDRVSRWFARQGFGLDYRFVAEGDTLPRTDSDYAAVVVYGGPQSANDGPEKPYIDDEISFIRDWADREKPLLGLCLGGQMLAKAYGASVGPHAEGLCEIGYYPAQPTAAGREIMAEPMHVYHWHGEGFDVPENGELLVEGAGYFSNQAFRIGRHAYGLQFHPEVTVPIFTSWMTEAAHMLEFPGAQSRETQFRAALEHDDRIAEWSDGFLARWLADIRS